MFRQTPKTQELPLIKLKNGSTELDGVVFTVMDNLKSLFHSNPILFYEFVMKCRDSNHTMFGKSNDALKLLGLIEGNNSVHDSVRNIVLSAVEGEGLGMRLGSPVCADAPSQSLRP
ncbi:MAG: hypothetical protein A3E83_03890 [Gammaproteobacteria bacterium RIFCSPHIGHO2_12_FULL_41_20]|nr:MAG: hypothetical protein A3E83_03890 [Gammaproteobacteria bacterium RIFCSPHIGHO2_12_FULL_41_20]